MNAVVQMPWQTLAALVQHYAETRYHFGRRPEHNERDWRELQGAFWRENRNEVGEALVDREPEIIDALARGDLLEMGRIVNGAMFAYARKSILRDIDLAYDEYREKQERIRG